MSDVETTTGGTPDVVPPETPQEGAAGMALVRIVGLPFNEAIVMGDITVTREDSEVPEDQLEALQQAANDAGVQLVVTTQ